MKKKWELARSSSGHEITHAFDDVGVLYDASGAFRPLYDDATLTRFRAAWDCVRRQYSGYSVAGGSADPASHAAASTAFAAAAAAAAGVEEIPVDGNLTLGENIADQGGLKISEVAYEQWLSTPEGAEGDSLLPALGEFTSRQLFYLG